MNVLDGVQFCPNYHFAYFDPIMVVVFSLNLTS